MAKKAQSTTDERQRARLGLMQRWKISTHESKNNDCTLRICNRACPLVEDRKGNGTIRSTRVKLKTFAHKRKKSVPRVEQNVLQ